VRVRRVVRSPFVFWSAALALAAITGITVSGALAAAHAAEAHWGVSTRVVIATRAVRVGEPIGPGDLITRVDPAGLVPPGALRSPSSAEGRTAVVALFPGETVLAGHVGVRGSRGAAALVPVGRRAVAVPTGGSSARVERGDPVDVMAVPAKDGGDAVVVAAGATVVDVTENAVTVSVTPDEARRVAAAVARGAVALAIRSPEEPG
jgi:Flp pilus assembly protein CpaB